jgi:RES domain
VADTPETAWAEWYRALAARAQKPEDDVPRELYEIAVDLDDVVDLSSTRLRNDAGLPTRMHPSESQWLRFQRFATAMRAEGAPGVLYASAARTRALCLCVFEAGLPGLRAVGEPVRMIAAPAPPRGLRT